MASLRIGVVGYSPPTQFDESEARRALNRIFDRIVGDAKSKDIEVVSGLTDIGVPGIAYQIAKERNWPTVGVACSKAFGYKCFPVDKQIIVGDDWGDESETFLGECDAIIRIGGGKQSHAEAATFKSRGGMVYEFNLDALPD